MIQPALYEGYSGKMSDILSSTRIRFRGIGRNNSQILEKNFLIALQALWKCKRAGACVHNGNYRDAVETIVTFDLGNLWINLFVLGLLTEIIVAVFLNLYCFLLIFKSNWTKGVRIIFSIII